MIECQGYSHISPRFSNISAPELFQGLYITSFEENLLQSLISYANTRPSVTARARISCNISRISLPIDHDLDLNCKVWLTGVLFSPHLFCSVFYTSSKYDMYCIGFEFARGRRALDMYCVPFMGAALPYIGWRKKEKVHIYSLSAFWGVPTSMNQFANRLLHWP